MPEGPIFRKGATQGEAARWDGVLALHSAVDLHHRESVWISLQLPQILSICHQFILHQGGELGLKEQSTRLKTALKTRRGSWVADRKRPSEAARTSASVPGIRICYHWRSPPLISRFNFSMLISCTCIDIPPGAQLRSAKKQSLLMKQFHLQLHIQLNPRHQLDLRLPVQLQHRFQLQLQRLIH